MNNDQKRNTWKNMPKKKKKNESDTHAYSLTHSPTPSLTLTHSLIHTHTLLVSHSFTHKHSLTHSLTSKLMMTISNLVNASPSSIITQLDAHRTALTHLLTYSLTHKLQYGVVATAQLSTRNLKWTGYVE